jgi:hypothetical protein
MSNPKTFEVVQLADDDPVVLVDMFRMPWDDEDRRTYAYRVLVDGEVMIAGNDLCSREGLKPKLREMAATLMSFLSAAGETLNRSWDRSDYWDEYNDAQRDFLASSYERLFAAGEGW